MKALGYIILIALVAGLVALIWWAFQSLWNALIPALFHGPVISYWQAAGMLVLFGFVTSAIRGTVKS